MACLKLREAILQSDGSGNNMSIHIFCQHVTNVISSILTEEYVALGHDVYLHVQATSSLPDEFECFFKDAAMLMKFLSARPVYTAAAILDILNAESGCVHLTDIDCSSVVEALKSVESAAVVEQLTIVDMQATCSSSWTALWEGILKEAAKGKSHLRAYLQSAAKAITTKRKPDAEAPACADVGTALEQKEQEPKPDVNHFISLIDLLQTHDENMGQALPKSIIVDAVMVRSFCSFVELAIWNMFREDLAGNPSGIMTKYKLDTPKAPPVLMAAAEKLENFRMLFAGTVFEDALCTMKHFLVGLTCCCGCLFGMFKQCLSMLKRQRIQRH